MTMPDQFSLRWNDYQPNLSQGISTFLECEDLVDVTLSAGGESMQAHKLILSISSPYFKSLFKANTCDHPIVIIKDVQAEQLRQILKFVYSGEVNIHRQELSAFLQTAELLQIKGLTSAKCDVPSESPCIDRNQLSPSLNTEDSQQGNKSQASAKSQPSTKTPNTNSSKTKHQASTDAATPPKKKKTKKDNYCMGFISEESSSSEQFGDEAMYQAEVEYGNDSDWPAKFGLDSSEPRIESEEWSGKFNLDTPEGRIKKEVNDWTRQYVLDPSLAEPGMEKGEWPSKFLDANDSRNKKDGWKQKVGGAQCPACNRIFANRYNLKVHVRDKHDTLEGTINCHICNKSMRNPSCLRVHLYHHRKQAALEQISIEQSGTSGGLNEDSDDVTSDTAASCSNGTDLPQ